MRGLLRLLPLALAAGLAAGAAPAQTVSLDKDVFSVDEPIDVTVTGITSETDWVTVVPAGTPADQYAQWGWVPASGAMAFEVMQAGSYEVRAYCCWSTGGYEIVSRVPFSVISRPLRQTVTLAVAGVQAARQDFTVGFTASPAHQTDWVAIARAGSDDGAYDQWFYTEGESSGSRVFRGLPPGEYEVRFYCCWADISQYEVQARQRIVVQ